MKFDRKLFMDGLATQVRCLYALMTREMMIRYGRDNLGFLWIFIEPMMLCVGVMVIWTFIREPFEHGIPLVAIVLTGYMPLTLWRHLTNTSVHVFRQGTNLLYHRHVSLLDIFFTRVALEFAGTTTAFFLVSTTLIATGLVEPPRDIGLVAAGWMLFCLLSAGSSLVIAVLTEYSEILEKFIGPFQYLSVPLSGFLFMVDWLPTPMQKAALYIPTVHCFEMIRGGFFGASVQTFYNPWYPALWGFGLLALTIGFVERARDYIHS